MLLLGSCLSGLNQHSTPNTAIFKSSSGVPVFHILVMCKCILINQPLEGRDLFYRLHTRGDQQCLELTKNVPTQTINSTYEVGFSPFSSPGEQVLLIIPILQMITMMLRKAVASPGHKGSKRGINQDSRSDLSECEHTSPPPTRPLNSTRDHHRISF